MSKVRIRNTFTPNISGDGYEKIVEMYDDKPCDETGGLGKAILYLLLGIGIPLLVALITFKMTG